MWLTKWWDNPINRWRTYVNEKYGYSIKLPNYWIIDDRNPDLIYLKENRPDDGAFFSQIINIRVYPGSGNLDVMQFLQQTLYANNNLHDTSMVNNQLENNSDLTSLWAENIQPTRVKVNGYLMSKIDAVPNLGGSYGDGYWVTHNNNGYFILFPIAVGEGDKNSEPDQVLSAFKFIN